MKASALAVECASSVNFSPANKVGEIDHPGYASTLLAGQVHCCIGNQRWYKVMVYAVPERIVNQQQTRHNGIDVPPCTIIQAVSSTLPSFAVEGRPAISRKNLSDLS